MYYKKQKSEPGVQSLLCDSHCCLQPAGLGAGGIALQAFESLCWLGSYVEFTDLLAPATYRGGDHVYPLLSLDLSSEITGTKQSRFIFKYK